MNGDLRTFLVMYENNSMVLMHLITESDMKEICIELSRDSNPIVTYTDVTNNTWIGMFPNSVKGKL